MALEQTVIEYVATKAIIGSVTDNEVRTGVTPVIVIKLSEWYPRPAGRAFSLISATTW